MEHNAIDLANQGDNNSCQRYELDNCNFVKTILMLVVIIGHCTIFWTGSWFTKNPIHSSPKLSLFANWVNSFHTYAFVMVSGYIFAYKKYERDDYKKIRDLIHNKAKRLLIPYVFVSAIWVVPCGIYFFHYTIVDIIKNYVLAISPSQLWFLVVLFNCFIIAWVLSDKIHKNDIVSLFIAIVSYAAGVLGGRWMANIFCVWTTGIYFPFFILGIKLREKNNWSIRRVSALSYLVLHTALFIVWRKSYNYDMESFQSISVILKLLVYLLGLLVHFTGALAAFFLLQNMASKIMWKDSTIFTQLRTYSMPMYLFHQQIIYFTIYWLNGVVNPYINASINFMIAVIISILISKVLFKFQLTRQLIGEK